MTMTNRAEDNGAQGFMRRYRLLILIAVPAVLLGAIAWFMLTAGRYQETDNAYVQSARVPISTSVTSRVLHMLVKENDQVKAGQVIFLLDRANPQADFDQSQAVLASAKTRVAPEC